MASAKSVLLDESLEVTTAPETQQPEKVMRPTVDLPPRLRMLKCTFWPESETKQAQFSGWSPEMGCYARVYGELATALYTKYGASIVAGEDTGNKVSLDVQLYPNANGLFFAAQDDDQRDYVSLNEYSIERVKAWKPSVVLE